MELPFSAVFAEKGADRLAAGSDADPLMSTPLLVWGTSSSLAGGANVMYAFYVWA